MTRFSARVYEVFIASPGDAYRERAAVVRAIYRWNNVFGRELGIVLLPVGWETHVAPQTGAHPQTVINRDALAKCSILVGIFRLRLGMPTEQYQSGTVEEIEEFRKA